MEAGGLRERSLDLGKASGYSLQATETLVRAFDANVQEGREALISTPDAAWAEPWALTRGDVVWWTAPRTVVVHNHINHLIHHGAEPGMYLRSNEIPVPSLYGPSAEERVF